MARVADGSQSSWGKLYEDYQPALLRFCSGFTRDRESAEEWAHEAFLRLKEKAATFRPGSEFRPWLYKIAKNICLQGLRRKRERAWLDGGSVRQSWMMAPDRSPSSMLAVTELSQRANDELQELSKPERIVFLLKYVQGLSRKEIAAALGTTEATIKMRLFRAMKTLRARIRSQG
jgi:RNA polymerase sigma factor (sigma-70 family)